MSPQSKLSIQLLTIDELLKDLVEIGCYPCISFRGKNTCNIWRAHVNGAGNFWADAPTPIKALKKAMRLWEEAGKPMDGYAATAIHFVN